MRRLRVSWLVILLAGVAACGGPTPSTGALSIAITGLPPGVPAAVEVGGPAGYAETVTTSRVLDELAPGTYTLSAATVADGNAIVPAVYDPTVVNPSVEVAANANEVAAITHAWRPPTGRLWLSEMGSAGEVLAGFGSEQLAEDGGPEPEATITNEGATWNGIAFDAAGNAWVARYLPNNSVARFRAPDLASSGTRLPDVTISSVAPTVLSGPAGLAFDAAGALWVSGNSSNTLVKYAPEQLATSGSPAPQVTLSSTGGSLSAPSDLAFDAAGNLWVANTIGGTVVSFTPAQLAASGSPTPEVTITSTTGALAGAYGLAFDATGNLWVAPLFGPALVRYDAGLLLTSGAPAPSAALTGFSVHKTLAFDHAGDLWAHVEMGTGSYVVRISDPGSTTGTSEAVVTTTIELDISTDGGYPTFFPPPPGLPIRAP